MSGLNRLSSAYQALVKDSLTQYLNQIFGYHALLYKSVAKSLVDGELSIKNQVVIDHFNYNADVVCRFEELPFAADCIDLAVLPNILQAAENPHQILREVERVLIPEGYLIGIGRNPWSWRGLVARYKSWRHDKDSKERDISRCRMSDWFRLLGFETEALFCVSLSNQKVQDSQLYDWFKRLSNFSCNLFGAYYIIIAKKKVSTLTPIRPSWRSNKQMVPSRLAEPSVRSQVENMFRNLGKDSQ